MDARKIKNVLKGTCSSVVIRKGSKKPELGQRGRMRAVTAASAQRIHRDCYTVGTQQRASGQQRLHIITTKADGHEAGNQFLVKLVIFITTICPLKPRRKPRTFNNLKSIIMAFIEPDTTFQVQLPSPCHGDRRQRGHKSRSGVKNKGLRHLWVYDLDASVIWVRLHTLGLSCICIDGP